MGNRPPANPSVKKDVPSSRENIVAKIEQARKASPSGTLGGATGIAGAKGSYQATGGGSSQIVVIEGKSYVSRDGVIQKDGQNVLIEGLTYNDVPAPQPQLSQQQQIVKELGQRMQTQRFTTTMTPEGLLVSRQGYKAIVPSYYRTTPSGAYVSGVVESRQGTGTLRPQFASGFAPDIIIQEQKETFKDTREMTISPFQNKIAPQKEIFFGTAAFEKRVANIQKLEDLSEWLIPSQNLQRIQDVANYATLGWGKPTEQRSGFGRFSQAFIGGIMGIPFYTAKLATQIPALYAKNLAMWEATAYKETRGKVLPEAGRSLVETGKYLISPEGLANITLGALLKGRADYKAGKFAGVAVKLKTTTVKPPIQENIRLAVMGKKGNIKSMDVSTDISWTVQGKRVTPITYGKILASEGKIGFQVPEIVYSQKGGLANGRIIYWKTPLIEVASKEYVFDPTATWTANMGRMTGMMTKPRSIVQMDLTASHEIIHFNYRGIRINAQDILPYRARPSEMIAYGLQQRYATKGFKVSPARINQFYQATKETVTAKAGEGLMFKYPRMQILDKARGMNAPTVSITKGTIIKGSTFKIGKFKIASSEQKYNVFATTTGRKTAGIMVGKNMDIFFQKTGKGDVLIKYLKKDIAEGKLIREFKGQLYSKTPAASREFAVESFVKGVKSVPYSPMEMNFKVKNVLSKTEFKKGQFDILKKVDTDNFAKVTRFATRERTYNVAAGQKDFIGYRDVSRSFRGWAKTSLTQRDISGSGWETITLNNKLLSVREIVGDIKYRLQPTWKPNTKVYKTTDAGAGLQQIGVSRIRPPLETRRFNVFKSESLYKGYISRPKPFKSLMTKLAGWGKKGQTSIVISKQLPKVKESVQAPSAIPRTFKPSTQIPLNEIIASNILTKTGKGLGFVPYIKPISVQIPSSIGASKSFERTKTPSISKTFTPVITRPYSKTETPTFTFTPVPTSTRSSTRTVTQAVTQTVSPVPTPSPIPRPTPSPRVPNIPTVRIPRPFNFNLPMMFMPKRKKKKIKVSQARQKYLPSYIAVAEGIYGKPQRNLTGLELRPIMAKGFRW